MASQLTFTMFFAVVALLLSVAFAIPGTATFYTQYVPSACYGNQDNGVMIAAASDALWNNGAICGKVLVVTCTEVPTTLYPNCTGLSVTVKIVDHCPGCGGTLNLSKEVFSAIANPAAGVVNIDYYW
ncbi:hypothetical protein SASPL_112063 [Salvia splendens]|uniref:Expansin-like EG45 domain-containing protein n=1 Tax=Salvia splendens TaxID=180675 RepID=A0A8X8YDM5_SALSN|nr:putative EG45-like domain containing protein 1 [Salvia splendens]KAG6427816.1 hypothetical protein SASPL_112063 [Salvia splendens]